MMNRICVIGSIIIIAVMIALPTYKNVKKDHEDKLLIATKMRITSASKKCFLDNVCTGQSTSLKFLYDHGYIEKQYNPVTKEYYDENYIIKYEDKKIVLDFI